MIHGDASMYGLNRTLNEALEKILEEKGDDVDRVAVMDALASDTGALLLKETADGMLSRIKIDASSGKLNDNRELREQFEERLWKHWRIPLEQLELFISLAAEVGRDFNKEYRKDASHSGDAVFETLTRLHARACQISSAVLALLRSGFADDAHARWRSLHEIAVVSSFISQHGQNLAERYLLHEIIQQYKLACEHQRYHTRINDEPVSQEEFDSLKSERDELVAQFGKPFKEDYGWAASVLGSRRPTIRAIEEQVNLDHWRPYYKMASDNVHANSHGAYFKLGLSGPGRDVLLAGPSNAGLADPGHSASISLHQVTTTMLFTRLSFDSVVAAKILETMVEEIGEAFLESHLALETIAIEEKESEAKT